MRLSSRGTGSVLVWLLVLAGCERSAQAVPLHPRPTEVRVAPIAETIAPPKVLPASSTLSVYSPTTEVADALVESGFGSLGPTYHLNDDALLTLARDRGVRAIYAVGLLNAERDSLANMSSAAVAATLTAQVKSVADNDTVGRWYLLPEELRHYDPEHMRYLEVATEAIRSADPKHRPIVAYVANHLDATAIAPIAAHVDIVAKGTYTNFSGHRLQRGWVQWSMLQANAGVQRTGASAWAVAEMFAEPPAQGADWIDRWVTHDVYAALLSGARGVLVYSGWPREGFVSRPLYLDAYAKVGRQLASPTGAALRDGSPSDDIAVEQYAGPMTLALTLGDGEQAVVRSLLFATRRVASQSCLWLVNSAMDEIRVRYGPIRTNDVPTATVGASAGLRGDAGWFFVKLDPLDVRCICVEPARDATHPSNSLPEQQSMQ